MPPNAENAPPPTWRWGVLLRQAVRATAYGLIVAAVVLFAALVWSDGPWWWAAVCTPVGAFVGIGAAVWVTDNLCVRRPG